MNYEPSDIAPHESWSATERWVWEKLCRGEEADFNKEAGSVADPSGRWDDRRAVSSAFLLMIALNDPWRGAINSRGVRIVGGWFRKPLLLSNTVLDHEIALESCRFDAPVVMTSMRTGHTFSLANSSFNAPVGFEGMRTVKSVHLRGASFDGAVEMADAAIGGTLDMKGARFKGAVNMERISISGSLFLTGALFEAEVTIAAGKVAGTLSFAGARLCHLDLTSAFVQGEMRLGRENGLTTIWGKDGRMSLRNAYAAALVDSPDAWPEELNLEGFVYNALTDITEGHSLADRETAWFKWWLRRHRPFSMQPYKQLARVLEKAGLQEKAVAVRQAAQDETGRFKLSDIDAA